MNSKAVFLLIVFLTFSNLSYSSQKEAANNVAVKQGQGGSVLTVEGKHIVVTQKESQLIILLDLFPNRYELDAAGKRAKDIVLSTARFYAEKNLLKSNNESAKSAVVYIVFVKSMDEYNRSDYAGMKRFGTLTYLKLNDRVSLSDNKLSKIP